MINRADQTLYEILEVDRNASQEEIVKAFQRAKATYSPSSPALYSVFSRDEADELLRLINEAYAVLSNVTSRRVYDQELFDKERGVGVLHPSSGNGSQSRSHSVEKSPDESSQGQKDLNGWDDAIPGAKVVEYMAERREPGAVQLNMGHTKFSEYQIDQDFENEIAHQEVFDGTFFQKVRNYKRVSLDQISEYSRVGRHYLVAVENNDFHSLPAPVFVRGFAQQIAKILGLNERKAVESYMKLFKQSREK